MQKCQGNKPKIQKKRKQETAVRARESEGVPQLCFKSSTTEWNPISRKSSLISTPIWLQLCSQPHFKSLFSTFLPLPASSAPHQLLQQSRGVAGFALLFTSAHPQPRAQLTLSPPSRADGSHLRLVKSTHASNPSLGGHFSKDCSPFRNHSLLFSLHSKPPFDHPPLPALITEPHPSRLYYLFWHLKDRVVSSS